MSLMKETRIRGRRRTNIYSKRRGRKKTSSNVNNVEENRNLEKDRENGEEWHKIEKRKIIWNMNLLKKDEEMREKVEHKGKLVFTEEEIQRDKEKSKNLNNTT